MSVQRGRVMECNEHSGAVQAECSRAALIACVELGNPFKIAM